MKTTTTISDISKASSERLYEIKGELIITRMKQDKEFSIFLDKHELDEEHTDTPEWKEYHTMLKDYNQVSDLLRLTDYYIKQQHV